MRPVEIRKNIHWVGGIDWDLRNFHGYLTQRGSTYNAYLITGERTVLVDTVKHYHFDEMIRRIGQLTDPAGIDVIVCDHVEMDHSGSLPRLMKLCPGAEVITSPNGEKGLRAHYDVSGWNIRTVGTGDRLDLGDLSVEFLLAQMVHWPDSMVSYVPGRKLLLSNDAFGQHIASPERFDDGIDPGILFEEARKYYANIVLPYGRQVRKLLDAASELDIEMIAPSHGTIWKEHVPRIIENYAGWASNRTVQQAVIVYDSMWGSTAKIARAIREAFEEKGISAYPADLKVTHISDIMTRLLESEYICVGSPTLNNGMMPAVASFLTYLKGLAPGKRTALAFGSYGWGGQSVPQIREILESCGFDLLRSVKSRYIPRDDELDAMKKALLEELESVAG
jgi:flavorubredoxin